MWYICDDDRILLLFTHALRLTLARKRRRKTRTPSTIRIIDVGIDSSYSHLFIFYSFLRASFFFFFYLFSLHCRQLRVSLIFSLTFLIFRLFELVTNDSMKCLRKKKKKKYWRRSDLFACFIFRWYDFMYFWKVFENFAWKKFIFVADFCLLHLNIGLLFDKKFAYHFSVFLIDFLIIIPKKWRALNE